VVGRGSFRNGEYDDENVDVINERGEDEKEENEEDEEADDEHDDDDDEE
jgi:hypothetical protein